MGFLPDLWMREPRLTKAAKAGVDGTHACHADVRKCLHKIVSHNGAGLKASIDEEAARAHDYLDKCDEAVLRAAGVTLDHDDDEDAAKAAGGRFDARTVDVTKLDPKDPLAFRKILTVVRDNPVRMTR